MAPTTGEAEVIEKPQEKSHGDSDSEMLNLEKELYSLTHYADDVGELVAQMFNTIKGPKLNAMLPPILKEIPLIDVQQLCLHELRGMSSRRILSIINGVEMSDSSSEEDDVNLVKDKKNKTTSKVKDDENSDENMEIGEDPNLTELGMNELEMRMKLIKTMLTKDGDEDEADDEFDPNIKIKEEPKSPARKLKKKSRRKRNESFSASSSSARSYRSLSSGSSSQSSSNSYTSSSSGCESELRRIKEEARKAGKKKITKKEFEERMKKAKLNRSYRKRKESDDESANEARSKKRRSKKVRVSKKKVEQQQQEDPVIEKVTQDENISEKQNVIVEPEEIDHTEIPAEEEIEEGEENEEAEDNDEDEGEKEEGEIDSNEELSLSDMSSQTNSSFSMASDSDPKSRRRRDKNRSSKRDESKSPSVPKVPNWDSNTAVLPKPIPENRQSISFAFGSKHVAKEESQDLQEHQLNADVNEYEQDEVEEQVVVKKDTTEIIGTIDPQEKNVDNESSGTGVDHSWNTRWLQSEKVQQVVSDSKMLSKVRKSIQAKGKAQLRKKPLQKPHMPTTQAMKGEASSKNPLKMKMVRGTVVDSADSFGLKVNVPQTLPTAKPPKIVPQSKVKSFSALLGSDDDEDSEDDDLWSQIMKN